MDGREAPNQDRRRRWAVQRTFTSGQVAVLVLSVGLAGIVGPRVVEAAGGALMSIADGGNPAAVAHVSTDGALDVGGRIDARPWVPLHAWRGSLLVTPDNQPHAHSEESWPRTVVASATEGQAITVASISIDPKRPVSSRDEVTCSGNPCPGYDQSGMSSDSAKNVWVGVFGVPSGSDCVFADNAATDTLPVFDVLQAPMYTFSGPHQSDTGSRTTDFGGVPLTAYAPAGTTLCLGVIGRTDGTGDDAGFIVYLNGQVGDPGTAFKPAPPAPPTKTPSPTPTPTPTQKG